MVELEATKVGESGSPDGVRYDAWIERTLPDGLDYLRSRFKNFDD